MVGLPTAFIFRFCFWSGVLLLPGSPSMSFTSNVKCIAQFQKKQDAKAVFRQIFRKITISVDFGSMYDAISPNWLFTSITSKKQAL